MIKLDMFLKAAVHAGAFAIFAIAGIAYADVGNMVSLVGQWNFALGDSTNCTDMIALPSTTDIARKGDGHINGVEVEKIDARRDDAVVKNQLTRHLTRRFPYVGFATYERVIDIPSAWAGRRLELFLERTKVVDVYLDGRRVGRSETLASPAVVELPQGTLPGRHTLRLVVDNRQRTVPVSGHQTSDDTQTNWNGVMGRMELRSYGALSITQVKTFPSAAENKVMAKVVFRNDGAEEKLEVEICVAEASSAFLRKQQVCNGKVNKRSFPYVAPCGVSTGKFTVVLGPDAQKWSEFNPVLHALTVNAGGTSKTVKFGLRDFRTKGTQFMLNERPVFLRGTHDACVWPLTGAAPMEVDPWRKYFATLKEYGLNHVRFHSWCPSEAAFEAADEAGFLMLPEFGAFGGNFVKDARLRAFCLAESKRIVDAYGNHPSFVMFTLGNECRGGRKERSEIVRALRAHDPRPLYAIATNGDFMNPKQCDADDFWVTFRSRNGSEGNVRGSYAHCNAPLGAVQIPGGGTMRDFSLAVPHSTIPLIGHETGQFQAYPDYSEIQKYTGVLKPINFEIFRDRLEKAGLGKYAADFCRASGRLMAINYLEEMEEAFRTPGFGGFQLLDIKDFPGQGTALVGILNSFMESKGFITPEEWRMSCSPTVLLARFPKYTYVNGENLCAEMQIAHYGKEDVLEGDLKWRIVATGRTGGSPVLGGHVAARPVVASGSFAVSVPVGEVKSVGRVDVALPHLARAERLELQLSFANGKVQNSYPLWVYPDALAGRADSCPPNGVEIVRDLDSAERALADGRTALCILDKAKAPTNSIPGFFASDFWNWEMFNGPARKRMAVAPGTLGLLVNENHPALAEFPTSFHSDYQWRELIFNGVNVVLDGDIDADVIVRGIDNITRNQNLGVIWEKRRGKGHVLYCSLDLEAAKDLPEARALRRSLLNYLAPSVNDNDRACTTLAALESQFSDPPDEFGVNCWWWWLNGNTDREAIRSELAAMKSRRFQGAMVFDAGGHRQGGHLDIPAGPVFGGKEWCDLFVFALDEAERLGLSIGFNIQSGWNLGGPCVTPAHAAKRLVCSQLVVEGGRKGLRLPQPKTKLGFYRDIAVLAFPLDDAAKASAPINFLEAKLVSKELGGSATDCRFLLDNSTPDKSVRGKGAPHIIRHDSIVNLLPRMSGDGTLDWTAPPGRWAVMRIGYTCTGARVSTSSKTWQGLALDYLSRDAFDFYWGAVVEPILARAGHHVGHTLKYMETDSWECGGMNWTDGFEREFAHLMGYDPLPYLAVLAGHVVDDMEATSAFLADFRKCIAHMIARNHYGRFAELAHSCGMGIQPESAGPHAGPLDGILNYSHSDIVMSEFWAPSPHRPHPPNRFFVKQASSVAHVYGKRIVGAESFTTIGPHWNDPIGSAQKSAFDHEICSGLNRVYFHTFTTSPASMGLPGQEYFAGTHVNPRVTWWGESAGFIDYMRRAQLLVQSGRFVADVLHYYGDHVPNIYPLKEADHPGALPGFDYDVADKQALLMLKVDEEGRIVAPSGAKYRVLTLPNHRVLSLAAIRKVESLVNVGAMVIGEKPERCVSLSGGSKAQAEFAGIVERLGNGRLVTGRTAREHLLATGVKPDFAAEGSVDYAHYSFADGDAYFVCSQTNAERDVVCEFRIVGRMPELWDPLTGDRRELTAFTQRGGVTSVPLRFDPFGAYFIVFRKPLGGSQSSATANYADYSVAATLDGAWKVSFDPAWDGSEEVEFQNLADWTENADERIKYYSGKAVYRKRFTFAKKDGGRYVLRLGDVKDVGFARVMLNGRDLGVAWTPPFRLDVTAALVDGENELEVMVVNSWFNRVKGDQLHPDRRQHTKTNIRLVGGKGYRNPGLSSSGLSPSGLLGPVQILVEVVP